MSSIELLIAGLQSLKPSRQPFPPWPSDEALRALIVQKGEAGLQEIAELYTARERVIREAKLDPFGKGFEWKCWKRADDLLPVIVWDKTKFDYLVPINDIRLMVVLGGNRASKTTWAVKRCLQSALRFDRTRLIFLCQKLETSRQVQQAYIWDFLPQQIKALNGKSDRKRTFYVKYQKGTGFSGDKIVFPNESEIVFLVYTQSPSDYEGIQVGCPNQPAVPGWYADESLPLDWLTLLRTRSATFDAVGIWTFTPLSGMTPSLKETIGQGKVLEYEMEPYLAGRQNLPGLPKGAMPTVQEGSRPDTRVIYFHTRENPLGGYDRVVNACKGKPWYMAERTLCGFTRDTRGRMFGTFGSWNVIASDQLPSEAVVYMHVDPHPARNWFILWVAVDPAGRVYAVDEWPPEQEFGEWAVATTRNPSADSGLGWDGDTGPAQEPAGLGIAQYKLEIQRREGKLQEARRHWTVVRRTVDRRAGPVPIPIGSGPSTCLWQELNDEQSTGQETVGGMDFELAGGSGIEEDGLELIRQALFVDLDKALDPLSNYPKLFVSDKCRQLIWALENFTGRDKIRGACKDPIDCLRDMFTSGLDYIEPGKYGPYGGGSY